MLLHAFVLLSFFFFKQKTAYEMRISDWSSDVCSSDLYDLVFAEGGPATLAPNRYSPHAGPALRCRMRQVPVAGDWDWGEETGSKAPRERAADIWLAAPVDGAPVVPVRVAGAVWVGRSEERRVGKGGVGPGRSRW